MQIERNKNKRNHYMVNLEDELAKIKSLMTNIQKKIVYMNISIHTEMFDTKIKHLFVSVISQIISEPLSLSLRNKILIDIK
jgi:hypothetical protein